MTKVWWLWVACVAWIGCSSNGDNLGTVPSAIEGAAEASVLLCDTNIQSATLADQGRVVVAHSVGWLDVDYLGQLTQTRIRETHQIVRVRDAANVATRHENPGDGPHWGRRFDESDVVSFASGETVELPSGASSVTIASTDSRSFWAVFRDDAGWKFGHYSSESGWQLHDTSAEPEGAVAQNGKLFAQTQDCALMQFEANGQTACVDARPPGSGWVELLGATHVRYQASDGDTRGEALFDTAALELVDLNCPGADLRSWVEEPVAIVVACEDGSHRLWSEKVASTPVDPTYPPERWPDWESARFLSTSTSGYYDAQSGQFVQSASSLLWVTPEGHDLRSRGEYPCPGMTGADHEYGQWRAVTCVAETTFQKAKELRRRSRTVNSCTSPAPRPNRITGQWLIDNKTAKVHKITGMKVVGLTEHGIVGIQGSGHDLEGTDGVRIVLQPYPPSDATLTAPSPTFQPVDAMPAVPTPADYEQAYYEYQCIFRRLAGDPDPLAAYEAVFERHGLPDGHSTNFTTKLKRGVLFRLMKKAEDCTVEEARQFADRTER